LRQVSRYASALLRLLHRALRRDALSVAEQPSLFALVAAGKQIRLSGALAPRRCVAARPLVPRHRTRTGSCSKTGIRVPACAPRSVVIHTRHHRASTITLRMKTTRCLHRPRVAAQPHCTDANVRLPPPLFFAATSAETDATTTTYGIKVRRCLAFLSAGFATSGSSSHAG
jgi:hypothetical protein